MRAPVRIGLLALCALGLAGLLAPEAVTAAPLSAEARQQILSQGKSQLSARRDALRAQAALPRSIAPNVELSGMKGKGAKAVKLSFSTSDGKKARLLLRVPGRGTGWGVRANDAVATLAAQLGEPEWVPVGIKAEPDAFKGIAGVHVDTGRKSEADIGKVMVVEFVPAGFKDGEDAPRAWLKSVPEASRVKAAVIDVLSLARDRKLANVMVNQEGQIRLIDHDITFGQKSEKGPHFPSAFWKGQSLGYVSPQKKFSDLPEPVRRVVTAIAEAEDLDVLKSVYPISREDRLPVLQRMARTILAGGLDAAVHQLVTEAQQKGFLTLDEAANAAALRAEGGSR